VTSVSATSPTLTTQPETPQHRKLVDAAQKFEAIFLQQMMKPFANKEEDGDNEPDQTAGGSTYQDMGVESMASAIARGGGFGIARSVVASVERQAHGQLENQKQATQP
jgi:flagellar protein FlgJ